jgi:hypothetical protein
MLIHELCVRIIRKSVAFSVNILRKSVTMLGRRLCQAGGPLVDSLRD